MVTSPKVADQPVVPLSIIWEPLPDDVPLEEKPVENSGQPLIAGALREALELADWIRPEMLIASNLGICATVNGSLVIKAPDWFYVATVQPVYGAGQRDRRSYTPNLEGEIPAVVMEFVSETDGGEYSSKRTLPLGKWFFYEQILRVPIYVIFEPLTGRLEALRLCGERYELVEADAENRYWLAELGLFLGPWQGEKECRQGYWLRWWNEAGLLLPWAVERLAAERRRVKRMAALLRRQGIDPEEIGSMLSE
jgi:Uma2 family endonuclease